MNGHIPSSASPRAGRSLEGLVAPLRERVAMAVDSAMAGSASVGGWLSEMTRHDHIKEPVGIPARTAWAICAITIVDMIRHGGRPDAERALRWFGIKAAVNAERINAALLPLADHAALKDLVPYLFDTYGRTSRIDVMRDASLSNMRDARKKVGSFYTPADVADFMVGSIASHSDDADAKKEWWVDTACGSGVFLTAALRRHRRHLLGDVVEFATTRLAGCDIAPQACDFAAFAILAEIASDVTHPLDAWRAIRRNLIALDATLRSHGPDKITLRSALPNIEGPLRLVCNPPYATSAEGVTTLSDGYPTKALYLPFIEMAWRVASGPRDSSVLVVPLSLGANRSADHRRCRNEMVRTGGTWTLLFFDRQPHALFGEDAKTRATIAIRRPGPTPAEINTSGLLKWTSRQRASIFDESRTASIGRANISRLVPKLGDEQQVILYEALEPFRMRYGARPEPTKAAAEDIVGTALSTDVFVAGTAYNFLNVFRNYPDNLSWRGTLSASGIHRLPCSNRDEADLVTAILSSRAAFWLWHTECDGFHVPAWFLTELPFLNVRFSDATSRQLADLGRRVWAGLQTDILSSTNRDRLTFAFRPTAVGELRGEIDKLILNAVGVDDSFAAMLSGFEQKVVSIDGTVRLTKNRNYDGDKNETQ